MARYQGKNTDGLGTTMLYEDSDDGEILSDDFQSVEGVVSDGEATVEMIHDFVEHLPHEDQWYDDSFDDGSLLMQGVTGHAVRRTEEEVEEVEVESIGEGPTVDSERNEEQRRILHSYEEYESMDGDSWTEESVSEEEEESDDDHDDEQQYEALLPEFDTSTQEEGHPDIADLTEVIMIEDLLGQHEQHYGDSHHLVPDEILSRTESDDGIDGMTGEDGCPDGQTIRDEMVQYDKSIVEMSEGDSEVAAHEIESDDDSETCPNEEGGGHYDENMSMDLTHGESVIFVEEEAQCHGLNYEYQTYKAERNRAISQAGSEAVVGEITDDDGSEATASVLDKKTEDDKEPTEHDEIPTDSLRHNTDVIINVESEVVGGNASGGVEVKRASHERSMIVEELNEHVQGSVILNCIIDCEDLDVAKIELVDTMKSDAFEKTRVTIGEPIVIEANQAPLYLRYGDGSSEAGSTEIRGGINDDIMSETASEKQSDGNSMTEKLLHENDGILGANKREAVVLFHDNCDNDVLRSEKYQSSDEDSSMHHSTEERAETSRDSRTFSGGIVYDTNSTEVYVLDPVTIPRDGNEGGSACVDDTMSLDEVFVSGTFHDTFVESAHKYHESSCSNSLHERETEGSCIEVPIDAESPVSSRGWSENGSLIQNERRSDYMHEVHVIEQYGEEECNIESAEQGALFATPEPKKRVGYSRPLTLEELAANSGINGVIHTIVDSNETNEVLAIEEDDSYATEPEEFFDPFSVPEPMKRIGYRQKCEDSEELVVENEKMRSDLTPNPHLFLRSPPGDEDKGSVTFPVLIKEIALQAEDSDVYQQGPMVIRKIHSSDSAALASQLAEPNEETRQQEAKVKEKQLEACIEAFGYYLDQRQKVNNMEKECDSLKAALQPPSEESGIYRAVPWREDLEVDGQIILRREDISRVPSSLLGDFCREDGIIRSMAADKNSIKSESASVYTDPDKDVPTPLVKRANASDRLGTSLVVPMGMDDREEENELEYSIIAESLGMEGVEDAITESRRTGNEDRTRKSVSWDEFAQVKSDDPFLRSGPLKLNEDTDSSGRPVRRKKKEAKKQSGCTRLCEVFHEAPYWTKVLIYVSITLFCIAFGILLTALIAANKQESDALAPALRLTPAPTMAPAPTMDPTIFYDLEPPKNVTIDVSPTVNPNMENVTMAPTEASNLTDMVESTVSTSGPPALADESLVPATNSPPSPVTTPAATSVTTSASTPMTSPATMVATTAATTPVASPATTNRPPFLWGK